MSVAPKKSIKKLYVSSVLSTTWIIGITVGLSNGFAYGYITSSCERKKVEIKETNMTFEEYTAKEAIKPSKLRGISDKQINDHWKLYQGYVKQVNALNKELKELVSAGKVGTLVYADRRRRYGFEYNGMVLHEYYFSNLLSGGKKLLYSRHGHLPGDQPYRHAPIHPSPTTE